MITQEKQDIIKTNATKMILSDIIALLVEQMSEAPETMKGYYWSVIKTIENLIETKGEQWEYSKFIAE